MLDDIPTYETFQSRFWAMGVLFSVSLFASSFPALSKRIRYLRIPRIVFFLGKHFGTGVILATAFVHLLQDAFDNLGHPDVKARWPIGKWTGLIVFGSLLSIFIVEYISTSYVDRLHSYSSPSPSPPSSRPTSPSRPSGLPAVSTERTPLLITRPPPTSQDPSTISPTTVRLQSQVPPVETVAGADVIFSGGHHRHEGAATHGAHCAGPKRSFIEYPAPGSDAKDSRPRSQDRSALAYSDVHQDPDDMHPHHHGVYHQHQVTHHHHHGGHSHMGHGHVHVDMDGWDPDMEDSCCTLEDEEEGQEPGKVKVGHKRQVVGILMLQLGIMIHSLVIGLTLSITSGAEFTSLITAIIFHQLFEGLSLGIRIAALPASPSQGKGVPVLKPTLAFTFAITTPIGIALGLALFGGGRSAGAQLKLTEGLLSAISAGMLIYAACVEMLAGDFVMDPSLWKRSIAEQAMALGSLVLGAAGMTALGLYD
ncbi:hypothetical protein EIP91_008579 [Steccherinum ochraceum]|uniref:High-affinity Zn(2+) transporter zrt1 n=1 Tax=Steccherinum ochraceum TaxID=92696 RepID=A0A4R0R4Y1_9APHY|nr:hypothetical protein EIP91_008579 [Steccherinum ochraceum]